MIKLYDDATEIPTCISFDPLWHSSAIFTELVEKWAEFFTQEKNSVLIVGH